VTTEFDLVVIGSGTGGYVAAIRAAQLGLRTAVIERKPVLGGTCLNLGCIPTKALLEHAHALKIVANAADWGVALGADVRPSIDLARVQTRKNSIVTSLTKGVEFLFRKNKIASITGTGRLVGAGRVDVVGSEPRTIRAREIIVATGSEPRTLPGVSLDKRLVITSDEAIHLDSVPGSIAVLGSGAVGVEFASIFRQFGSDVMLIEIQPRLVPNEDEAVSRELEKAFRKRGIHVQTATRLAGAEVRSDRVHLELEGSSGTRTTVDVDRLLVAVGRKPVTDGLAAADIGIRMNNDFIQVDSLYRTSVEGVSAIGDVIAIGDRPHPQLAHVSSAEGVLVADRIAGHPVQPLNYDHMPASTYCEPEIASVGLTEAAARARGFDVRVGTFPFSALGRARIAGETDGFVKIVGESKYDELLGVHIIGPRATELIAEATTALGLEATVESLVRTVHAHPTLSEAVGEAAHATIGKAINL
jgi:dihydrolipoamide dehydrogenase